MLKTIDPLLTGDLLKILADMGHGDDLALVDANFPAREMGRRVVELPGTGAVEVLEALLSLFPLDDFVEAPLAVMDPSGQDAPIYSDFARVAEAAEGRSVATSVIDRFAFYDQSRKAFAVVITGERRLYGNVILKKGVIRSSA